jgi:hypothetical protein
MRISRSALALICAVYSAGSDRLNVVHAAAVPKFPLIFYPPQSAAQAGLAHDFEKQTFETACYYFPQGGPPTISISAELLAYYAQQGFSRRSLCMALISGIRFDPETGRRLATYVVVYLLASKEQPEGDIAQELPLAIPSCFARALPYSDCAWNFDPLTGKRLSAAFTQRYRAFGQKLEGAIRAFKSAPHEAQRDSCPDDYGPDWPSTALCSYYRDSATAGYVQSWLGEDAQYLKKGQYIEGPYIFDLSEEFPEGFGYGLIYYETGLGPSISVNETKAALAGAKRPAQVDPAKLKELWGYGGQ